MGRPRFSKGECWGEGWRWIQRGMSRIHLMRGGGGVEEVLAKSAEIFLVVIGVWWRDGRKCLI